MSFLPPPLRFSPEAATIANHDWRCNCGPGALCAVLGMTPSEIRPHLLDFEAKGYTNPTLMVDVLRGLGVAFHRLPNDRSGSPPWPTFGLVRVQWSGPWTKPGVPARVAYRHTHWVASCCPRSLRPDAIFDVNTPQWILFRDWTELVVPDLLKHCEPKADGKWWVTHSLELRRGVDGYAERTGGAS